MKSKTKRYLVVTECKGTGYVIGFYNVLKEAEEVVEKLHFENDCFWRKEEQPLYEQTMNYPSYKVHPTCAYPLEHCPRGGTDGTYYTHVFDTSLVKCFTLREFIFERTNTILACNNIEYKRSKKNLLRIDIQFIAN